MITVVNKIYSGAVDARGRHLYPGGQPFGSELAWAGWMIPTNPGEELRGVCLLTGTIVPVKTGSKVLLQTGTVLPVKTGTSLPVP